MNKIQIVKLSEVKPDPEQPRQEFDPHDMKRLVASIQEKGILNPLILEEQSDGTYLIVDGERRYRASKELKLKEVPAIVYPTQSQVERLVQRFHLQEQHSNWSSFDKARAISALQQSTGLKPLEIAHMLGLPENTVRDYLLLINVSKRTMELLDSGKISFHYIPAIQRICKVVDDRKLRSALEVALVEKVSKGFVDNSKQLSFYRIAIQKKGDVMTKMIIEQADLTPKQAITASNAHKDVIINRIRSHSNWFSDYLRKAIDGNCAKMLSESDVRGLERIIKVAQKLVDDSGVN